MISPQRPILCCSSPLQHDICQFRVFMTNPKVANGKNTAGKSANDGDDDDGDHYDDNDDDDDDHYDGHNYEYFRVEAVHFSQPPIPSIPSSDLPLSWEDAFLFTSDDQWTSSYPSQ